MKNKKFIKFYGSLFHKFLYIYIHVRVNNEDVWVNNVNKVHLDNFLHACFLYSKKTMRKKKVLDVHKF